MLSATPINLLSFSRLETVVSSSWNPLRHKAAKLAKNMEMGHGKPTEGIVGAAIEFPQFFLLVYLKVSLN